jgi:hypothetical protein
MSDEAKVQMPRYVSHKTVHALELKEPPLRDMETGNWVLQFADAGCASVLAPDEMFSRYKPVVGDFYVVYADGYKSFSPRKAFLEGYTRA